MRATIIDIDRSKGPLIRWGAIFAGAVWGLAVMAVLSSLWLAVAYPSNNDFIRDNLEWFVAGSGGFALLVAGLVAGSLSDNRGAGSGLLHGMTAWALLLITTLVFGLPSVFGLFNLGQLRTIDGVDLVEPAASDALWATFITLVVGAAAAAIGGMIGGAPRRGTSVVDDDVRRSVLEGSEARDGELDTGRHAAPEPLAADATAAASSDRVMVRRAEDGTFVDQEGHRYVSEEAGAGPPTAATARRADGDVR